jgi:hypothetical protein
MRAEGRHAQASRRVGQQLHSSHAGNSNKKENNVREYEKENVREICNDYRFRSFLKRSRLFLPPPFRPTFALGSTMMLLSRRAVPHFHSSSPLPHQAKQSKQASDPLG